MTSPDEPLTQEEFEELLKSLRERRDLDEATQDDYYDPTLWDQK
jgi:hypothetical protein